ncbi:MAG: Spy/CpxP family protein refolding chaperone [Chitinophagaceae bacterium]
MKSTNKILLVSLILLLLVNIGLVIFLMKCRNHPEGKRPGKGNPFEMMDKELNLSDQQKTEVKKLRDAHFAVINPLSDSVRAAKTAFFDLLKQTNVSDSVLNAYGKRITDFQSTIDKLAYAHFQRVRNLFDSTQKSKYDEFIRKMVQRGRKDSTEKKK